MYGRAITRLWLNVGDHCRSRMPRRKMRPYAMSKPGAQPMFREASGHSYEANGNDWMGYAQMKRARKHAKEERKIQTRQARSWLKRQLQAEVKDACS